ncbi:MAG: hypothetical protein ACKVX7_05130, partial [Planctomycetota bacterium]
MTPVSTSATKRMGAALVWLCACTLTLSAQTGTGYDYDVNGNRTLGTGQARFTGVGEFSFEPNRAVPGERINIYGRNFPLAAPGLYSVSFAGALGTVVSVAERVIAVDIPVAAAPGDVVLTLPDGTQIVLGSLFLQGIVVTPSFADLSYGAMQQFSAQLFGVPGGMVTWSVESVTKGASAGTISASGLYVAPSAATGAFPVLIKATSADLGQTAYALVRGQCSSSTPLAYSTLTAGSFAAGFERDCYDFTGQAGQLVGASYIGTPSARRFRILNENGYPLATAATGTSIAIPALLLPTTGNYRLEVEAASGASGGYQVWIAVQSDLTPGRWVHPGDGFWHESSKWSGGVTPTATDNVLIPDFPGTVTVTVSQGLQNCASISSLETLRIQGGTLTVVGEVMSNAIIMAGGTFANATVLPGAGGQGIVATANGGTLSAITLDGAPLQIPSGADMTIRNGLALDGSTVTLGSTPTLHAFLYCFGTQTISGTGQIVLTDGTSGWTRFVQGTGGSGTTTIGPGITVRGPDANFSAPSASYSFVNLGTIRAEAGGSFIINRLTNGGTLDAQGGSFDLNNVVGELGIVTVSAGGTLDVDGNYEVHLPISVRDASTLTLRGTWVNSSSISMTNSTVNLGGAFSLTGLGSFSRTGGTVNLTGVLNLAGMTLNLNATTGDWRIVGGTLLGGTLNTAAGGTLVPTSTTGVLDAMTIGGTGFTIPSGTDLTTRNGLTLASATITMGTAVAG